MLKTSTAIIRFLLVCGLSCAGCDRRGGLVAVSGVVTLDGKPLSSVQVMFDQPELGPNENRGYVGWTRNDGRYSLRPIDASTSGVPAGAYRVSLTTATTDPSAPPAPPLPGAKPASPFLFEESPPTPPERVPHPYRSGKLKFTVPAGGTETADFALRSK